MVNKKKRTPIPEKLSAQLLYAADHTCCICNKPGVPVQIHHIDENPTDHSAENLAVLCLVDHNRTMLKGGFGRHLGAEEVRLYRDAWNKQVEQRRERIDREAAKALLASGQEQKAFPSSFVELLPKLKETAEERSRELWSGTTADMLNGSYEYIDAVSALFVALSEYNPEFSFDPPRAQAYLSSELAKLFEMHRNELEPEGPGSGGTVVNVEVAGRVMADIEDMVEDQVRVLATADSSFDFLDWKRRWKRGSTLDSDRLHDVIRMVPKALIQLMESLQALPNSEVKHIYAGNENYQGRKRAFADHRTKIASLRLDADEITTSVGDSNLSDGIFRLFELEAQIRGQIETGEILDYSSVVATSDWTELTTLSRTIASS